MCLYRRLAIGYANALGKSLPTQHTQIHLHINALKSLVYRLAGRELGCFSSHLFILHWITLGAGCWVLFWGPSASGSTQKENRKYATDVAFWLWHVPHMWHTQPGQRAPTVGIVGYLPQVSCVCGSRWGCIQIQFFIAATWSFIYIHDFALTY